MIDKSITSLSDVEINALEQIINESNFYNSITVAESPFSSIAVFDDNDVMQVKPFAAVDITYGEENVNVVLSRSSEEKCWFIKITDNGYVIRGDNLLYNEYEVTDDDIIGVLKAFYRNGKYYDCATSKAYKAYIILNQIYSPIRIFWRLKIKVFLSKIKRLFIK